MAEKLKMMSSDIIQENIDYIATKFRNALKEVRDEKGQLIKRIDFDVLKQELSDVIIDDKQERYQMTWPDKKKSILLANSRINGTLRPDIEKSVDFENTKNIYVEGDNLDVLKLLRETYLNKVKMIYIDPPYNTGSDFVYEDNFSQSSKEYLKNSGQYDEQGNRLFINNESNGRFHTDWLNMIYPRIKISKDFLTDDGAILISIDENEAANLKKICDEIFGEKNFISQLGWQKVYAPKNQARYFSNDYEFILCYCKNIDSFKLNDLPRTKEMNLRYKNPDNDPRGEWKAGDCVGNGVRANGYYDVIGPTGKVFNVPEGKHWVYAPDTMKQLIADNRIWWGKDGTSFPAVKQFLSEVGGRKASSFLTFEDYGHTDMAKKDLIKLFPDLEKVPFDTPKPIKLIKMLSTILTNENDLIMDYFAGSATTAEAIMRLNVENNTNRTFVLVQLPEKIENNQGAINIGLHTISDISQERIRRAGNKIKEEWEKEHQNEWLFADEHEHFPVDIGFRVLKLDSSNMNDVYYNPNTINQTLLDSTVDNVKPGRTGLDLLFQVMLELGVELSAKIEEKTIFGKQCFVVNENDIVACFDDKVTDEVTRELAKIKPLYAVFKDSSFDSDSSNINCEQIFKSVSPTTTIKVI